MKKLITLLILHSSFFILNSRADDWTDLFALAEQANTAAQVAEASEQRAIIGAADVAKFDAEINGTARMYVGLRIFQFEVSPAFMGTRLAYPNTLLWYLWNEYDTAQGFEKLRIGARIQRLSR